MSRKSVQRIIDAGGAFVDKKRIMFSRHQVFFGQNLEIHWNGGESRADSGGAAGKPGGAVIRMLTPDFCVVAKPAGIPSQATLTDAKNTILAHAARALRERGEKDELHLVHRLDKDTSGLLLLGRNKKSSLLLEEEFRRRAVRKLYHALCFHAPKSASGVSELSIAKHPSRPNTMQIVPPGRPNAKAARTAWTLVRNFERMQSSALSCRPETGRTHQIRVHLMALGCPLLGDKTYAQNEIGHPMRIAALRHMLHAAVLEFEWQGETVRVREALPADMRECLKRMGDADGSVADALDAMQP